MTDIGTTLYDRYRLEAELGRGGLGVVYRAYDTLLERDVAVKVLSRTGLGTEGRARLLHEARSAAKLNHPNVVSVHDAGEADGSPFIVMELVEGASLFDLKLTGDNRPDQPDEVLTIARQICAALEHAHAHGVVHRDLKPENVLIAPDGSAKLVDFGLARSPASRLTSEGTITGTVFYLAPELALGQDFDGRADLYALGVMLYELTTGRLPFTGDDPLAVITQHLHAPVVPPRAKVPEIPPTLDTLIVRLLSKSPADRPANAAEVGATLERLASGAEAPTLPHVVEEPSVLERIKRGRMVGREAELAQARDLWRQTVSGAGQMLLISGEPGIGKTRLVQELVTQAQVQGGQAFVGASYRERGTPYGPFAQMVEQALMDGSQGRLGLTDFVVTELVKLAPMLQGRYPEIPPNPELEPQAAQYRLFEGLVALCRALASQTPVLLVLEDLHWADGGTLALLQHLARRTREEPVLLLATYREVELSGSRPLQDALRALNRERLAARLKLSRLDRAGTEALLGNLFGEAITPEFLDRIYQETEGNPFFVEEVCKALVERGELYFRDGRWQRPDIAELEVPQSVRVAIQNRVDRLPEAVQEVLTTAAVLGRTFDFETLTAVSEAGEDELIEALETAERAQLIAEVSGKGGGTFTFAHALIPGTLVEALSGLRRRRLHRRVGGILGGLRPRDTAAIAHHFWQAGAAEGLPYLHRAGDEAAEGYANEEALAWYTRALDLAPEADLEANMTLLLAREKVYDLLGEREAQAGDLEALGELAAASGQAGEQAEVALRQAKYAYVTSDYPSAVEAAQQAIALAGDAQDREREARAYLSWGRALLSLGEQEAAEERLRRALELARATGLPNLTAESLDVLGFILMVKWDYASSSAYWEQALAIYRETGDRRGEALTLSRLGGNAGTMGDHMRAQRYGERALAVAREIGDRRGQALILTRLASAAGTLGNFAAAQGYLEQALTIFREIGDRASESAVLSRIGLVIQDQGDYAAAQGYYERAIAIAREISDRHAEGEALRFLAQAATGQGRYTLAQGYLEQALPVAREIGCQGCEVFALSRLGTVAWSLGDYATARGYFERTLAIDRETGNRHQEKWALINLGKVAGDQEDFSEARGYAEQALSIAREVSDRPGEAAAVISLGEALAGMGERDAAAAAFQQAITLREELNLPHLVVQSRAGLARVALAMGEADLARDQVDRILSYLDDWNPLDGAEAPFRVYWTCYQVLQASADPRADQVLERAYQLLQEWAADIPDEETRHAYLENVPWHREIVHEWEESRNEAGKTYADD